MGKWKVPDETSGAFSQDKKIPVMQLSLHDRIFLPFMRRNF